MKFPSPKQGTKEVQIGQPVVERERIPRSVNPLSKSIWISRFHPETKPEEIENYIVNHTDAKDKTKFKCTMLVKKDADISKMSFVSYKIDTTPEVYDILIDPENWPNNKHIREFVKIAPTKLKMSDFAPPNKTSSNVIEPNEIEKNNAYMIEIANELGIIGNGHSSSINGNGNSTSSSPSKN